LDGEETYLAYAPLETVGWTMLVGVSKETLRQPSKELVAHVDEITYETLDRTKMMSENLKYALLLIAAGLIFLSVFTSLRYSRKLVRPIRVLKNAGVRFIEREDIGLKYTQDFFGDLNLYTGDETEDLWLTMRDLEQNFRTSMQKLEGITAEKERIDTELSIAARLQSDMLPKVFPAFPERQDFDLFAFMKPAKEVGGDFYDFFLTDDDHLALVMADVSGKGVPAAMFMVVARTMIKNLSLSEGCESPGRILETVNNNLCENNDECMFVTVWLGCITLSTGELKWASAGHEYPALCRTGGNFELIKDIHGPGLGTFEDIAFEEQSITLGKGDLLFLYTDGIPEATDEGGNIFGTERMTEALDKSREEKGLRDMASSVKSSVDAFVKDTPQFDDITMMMFEYRGI
ncbi:MAG: SpoIIE family protein phosphatase, partial [Lachnospiraceae bacterium]|nr:SpoIIE family protein phosphatase [Lachnospiraceae bacterium]